MPEISKLLIANRGEIAVRIARTARRLGLATVAVYSDADRLAAHVSACDEGIHLGPAPASESYLRADLIIAAARRCGAEAIHPGYGFLAENAGFAAACERAGLIFVGPPAAAIERLGSKAAAKLLAQRAGVPVARGYHGPEQTPEALAHQAADIGYPLLIKPVAGGGGKGMRRVARPEDFAEALAACQREALASFGDSQVLIEQFIAPARHVEVQVLADAHGHCVHLFDRDCSAQRRHQKLIEEAPAPRIAEAQRARMSAAAVALAREAGYVSAGTVEFLVGSDGAFYFLEMNTRLQVEHGVTELVCGLDLVEWQLRIARGESLSFGQDEVRSQGHAIEVRLCAEDPAQGFLPGTGRLERLVLPGGAGVRIDGGFRAGDTISPYYDSLLVKVMAHGPSRQEALARLERTLAASWVVGVANNREFLLRMLRLPEFARAAIDTGFIEREQARLTAPGGAPSREVWLLAALAVLRGRGNGTGSEGTAGARANFPWGDASGWRLNSLLTEELRFRHEKEVRRVRIEHGAGSVRLELEGCASLATPLPAETGVLRVELDGRELAVLCSLEGTRCQLLVEGDEHHLEWLDPLAERRASEAAEHSLRSPLPGRVIAVYVREGEGVARGAPLLAIEAMKMEHTITAPADGVIAAVHFAVGEQVSAGADLLELDPPSGPEAADTPRS